MRWYVVMWQGGGKTLNVKRADSVGFTKNLADAAVFDSRELAWKAARSCGWQRAVPEAEEVVVRHLMLDALEGRA